MTSAPAPKSSTSTPRPNFVTSKPHQHFHSTRKTAWSPIRIVVAYHQRLKMKSRSLRPFSSRQKKPPSWSLLRQNPRPLDPRESPHHLTKRFSQIIQTSLCVCHALARNCALWTRTDTPADHFLQFIVMFRSRFNECFPGKCPQFGPQDIERGVVNSIPSPEVQNLLCALLGLVLNRKKPVE